ncbi:hypothetical protein GGF31_001433 [Allomyces arbusculus]|nr:hypothetical protein GGF31_001433 [Allomyces arbusculus]
MLRGHAPSPPQRRPPANWHTGASIAPPAPPPPPVGWAGGPTRRVPSRSPSDRGTAPSPTQPPASPTKYPAPPGGDLSWPDYAEMAREQLLDEGISGIYRVGSPVKAGRRGIGARVHVKTPEPADSPLKRGRVESIKLPDRDRGDLDSPLWPHPQSPSALAPSPALFDQAPPVHSDVDRLRGHASDRVYRSGFFQATTDCTLQPLYGTARTPDADDPPVKVRVPAAVAHALQVASARPVMPRSRHTYRDTDSMALSAHLYSGAYPNLRSRVISRLETNRISLRSHLRDANGVRSGDPAAGPRGPVGGRMTGYWGPF